MHEFVGFRLTNEGRSTVSGKATSAVAKLLVVGVEVTVIELFDGDVLDRGMSQALKECKNESCVKVNMEADWIY